MTKARSALIIGGGHNGLVCAALLARKGLAVTLCEARNAVGGGLAPGNLNAQSAPGLVHSHMPLHPTVLKELGVKPDPAQQEESDTIALGTDGQHIHLTPDRASGSGISAQDAQAYSAFKAAFLAYAKALGPMMLSAPPRLKEFDKRDAMTLAKTGWALRFGLGVEPMREFLRVAGMNIYDVLDEQFETPALQGAIALEAVLGCHVGPRTPNTVLPYLMRLFHEDGRSRTANPAATSTMLEDAARRAGASIRVNAAVEHILVEEDRACGVTLKDGEELRADIVVSNADAKSTFLTMVGPQHMDAMFIHRISKTRTYGDVARLTLSLKDMPKFTGLSAADLAHRLVIAPDMRSVERAFNASKYGEFSKEPVMDIQCATPSGQGPVLMINAAYAPYRLKQGWETGRDAFQAAVLAVLGNYAPGIEALIDTADLLTPVDIEREYGIAGGHWHHGEMAIDQAFMMRPVHGSAQYSTPLPGLYLCGAAAHPGGDITGLPGRNAAKRILATA
jgi:phytoene dehydrogenase-like protein